MGYLISIERYLQKKSAFATLPDIFFEEIDKGQKHEICTAPPSKYRVVGEGGKASLCWVVDDYPSSFLALQSARKLAQEAMKKSSPARFSAYDDRGEYLGRKA